MNNKYELLADKTITSCGHKLFRIRALVAFADVKPGDEGGYVESENNLSVCGNAWVYGDAQVCENARVAGNARVSDKAWVAGNARVFGDAWVCNNACVYGKARVCDKARVCGDACVYGDARVCGDAQVCGNSQVYRDAWVSDNAHHLCIYPIGSRDDAITFFRTKELKISVVIGCFCGDIDQFEAQVQKTHGDNSHAIAYALAAQLARARIDLTGQTGSNKQDEGAEI